MFVSLCHPNSYDFHEICVNTLHVILRDSRLPSIDAINLDLLQVSKKIAFF